MKRNWCLTIRGDLLKNHPDTLVFAQKPLLLPDDEDNDDGTKIERELTDAEFRDKVKFPLYRADVPPDIKFFGFDLTMDRAKELLLVPIPIISVGIL
mgnify:CR=1 FL=1